jgi:hypothetical protein
MLKSALFAMVFMFTSFAHSQDTTDRPDCREITPSTLFQYQIQFTFPYGLYLDNFNDYNAVAQGGHNFALNTLDRVPGNTSVSITTDDPFVLVNISDGRAILRSVGSGRLYSLTPAPSSNPQTVFDLLDPENRHIIPIRSGNIEVFHQPMPDPVIYDAFCIRHDQNIIPASATEVEEIQETSIAL